MLSREVVEKARVNADVIGRHWQSSGVGTAPLIAGTQDKMEQWAVPGLGDRKGDPAFETLQLILRPQATF